jgi:hypothetical protein
LNETVAKGSTLLEIKDHKLRKAIMIKELLFSSIDSSKEQQIWCQYYVDASVETVTGMLTLC